MIMDEQVDYGPAMAQLTDLQRKFVLAMMSDPFGTATDWARLAGYSDIANGCKVAGHHAVHDPKIETAVYEMTRALLHTVGPAVATATLLRVAADPKHKHHLRAAELIANRVGFHEVSEVRVEHTHVSASAARERISQLAAKHGLDPQKLLGSNAGAEPIAAQDAPIEAEFSEVQQQENGDAT